MALSPHVPDLSALEVLLAIARTGSLTKAAIEVGVSQQAISERVRSLEAQTGVVLVRRSSHGSRLSDDGIVVAEWSARVLEVAAELDAGLAALRQDRRRRLRVSASLTIAELLLPGWLVAYRFEVQRAEAARAGIHHRPPGATDIVLTAANSETVITHVLDGRADIGFIEGPGTPKSLRSRVIGTDRLILVVPPTHVWARRRTPLDAAELAATALVSREEGSGTREALSAALRAALGPQLRQAPPSLSLSTTSAVRAAVLAGAGAAVLSELAVSDDLARGALVAVDVTPIDLRRTLRAVWRGDRVPPAGAGRDLINHILNRPR